jgi:hypothetical protein
LCQNVRRLSHDTIFASLINNSFESSIEKSTFWNESCRLQNENSVFYNHFDNYRWRESSLKIWFLFEYFMLIQIIFMRDSLSIDISFENLHLTCERFVQRFIQNKENIRTIFFVKSLFFQQDEKNKIFEDHVLTNVIKNHMMKILLKLFISWHKLSTQMYLKISTYIVL